MEGPLLQSICCRTVPRYIVRNMQISLFRLVCTFSYSIFVLAYVDRCVIFFAPSEQRFRNKPKFRVRKNHFTRSNLRESIRLGSYLFVSRFVVVLSFSAKKVTCSCRLAYVLQDIKN